MCTRRLRSTLKNSYYYLDRGIEKLILGDTLGAIDDYTIAIENNPEFKAAYANRGSSRVKMLSLKGACFDWRKAVDLGLSGHILEWNRNQC